MAEKQDLLIPRTPEETPPDGLWIQQIFPQRSDVDFDHFSMQCRLNLSESAEDVGSTFTRLVRCQNGF